MPLVKLVYIVRTAKVLIIMLLVQIIRKTTTIKITILEITAKA